MGYFRASDIPLLFADFGVSVTLGAVTEEKGGLFDDGEGLLLEGETTHLRQGDPTVIVQTGKFPALANGAAITVDGTGHTVRDHAKIGDGALTRVWLE